jgi:hypothetical protein
MGHPNLSQFIWLGLISISPLFISTGAQAQTVVYVDSNATSGAGNGSTWSNAYLSLQHALIFTPPGTQIWVAAGTYSPCLINGQCSMDRSNSFRLRNGIAIYGGFCGGETRLDQRDPMSNLTILTGDLAGDDITVACAQDRPQCASFGNRCEDAACITSDNIAENSFHVVSSYSADDSAILSGFTITGGNANGSSFNANGGGVYVESGCPTLTDCILRGNSAKAFGGGMFSDWSSYPTLINCTFKGNSVQSQWAPQREGGGMYTSGSMVVGCSFIGNHAETGGGMLNAGNSTVLGCSFARNHAEFYGGGLFNAGPFMTTSWITNCKFSGNSASYGGGVFNDGADVTITGCTISNNFGGGIFNWYDDGVTLANSVVWGNVPVTQIQSANPYGSVPAVANYSIVQGDTDGTGSLFAYPRLTPSSHLQSGSPGIDAGSIGEMASDLADSDGDGDTTEPTPLDFDGDPRVVGQEMDIGADEFHDADTDGLPDWWETLYFGSPTAANAFDDVDKDGTNNLEEYEQYGSNPTALPLYVHVNGNDSWNGLSPIFDPINSNGPKATIQAALSAASSGDTVLVIAETDTVYSGLGNSNLDFGGKSIVVRKCNVPGICDDPGVATIDCANAGRAVNLDSIRSTFAVMEGFSISQCSSDFGGGIRMERSRFMLKDCALTDNTATSSGGGLYCESSSPSFNDVIISDNSAFSYSNSVITDSSVSLLGGLVFADGSVQVGASWFYGPGYIDLKANSLLTITGNLPQHPFAPSVIRSNIIGTGDIRVELGQELWIEGGAIVELSGQIPQGSCSGGCLDPTDNDWGTIFVDGVLLVRGGTIRNTNVRVSLAEFEGNSDIINNDIRMVEVSTGYGGEFYVEGSSTIECNTVISEGDRYLDLDPDPDIPIEQRPIVCDNRFFVEIKQGANNTQGTLLELRSEDLDCDPMVDSNGCISGAFQLPGSDGFDVGVNTWVLEELEILQDAKLNLTNRQGFEYDVSSNGLPETVYVKDLLLHPNAVLNTALQRLYYQTLSHINSNGDPIDLDTNGDPVEDNGAEIIDIPLLGFSLAVIAMEDQTEFDVRVRIRVRDPVDLALQAGSVYRINTNGLGVMDMRTQAEDWDSASSVAAKGAFARAGKEDIRVTFEYQFVEDPNSDAELVVYLSDNHDVGTNLVELARVSPPATGRPGSVGSGQMAVFEGTFPRGRGDLNFTRGTYVELKLRGQSARVWIDNWDPQIECLQCGDLNGTGSVDNGDLLILLSEYGRDTASHTGGDRAYCLDIGFHDDGYVDQRDFMAWDTILSGVIDAYNFCDTPFGVGRRSVSMNRAATLPPPDSLFVAGKPGTGGDQQDFLYTYDIMGTIGACVGSAQTPASNPGVGGHRGNGLLTKDSTGEVYQIHATQGLIRLSDGAAIVPSATGLPVQGGPAVTVSVGITELGGDYTGVPLGDAAFDPTDDSVVFVVPVLVSSNGYRYRAAAKLALHGGGTYTVERLYGKDPRTYSTITPIEDLGELIGFVYEPDRHHLREIEVDAEGKVYVTSAQEVGENDWVLVYDEALGNSSERAIDISDEVSGPTSMLVSSFDDKLYLSSSVNTNSSGLTRVYRYTIDRGAGNAPDLTLDGHLAIDNPTTNGFNNCNNSPCGHVASVTSIQEDPNDGALYVVGFTAPKVDDELSINDPLYGQLFGDGSSMLATPTLAVIPASANGPMLPGDTNPVPAARIDCDTLSLPLSAVFVPGIPGDCDGDGNVGLNDLPCFASCLGGPGAVLTGECQILDLDGDEDVDLRDFAVFSISMRGLEAASTRQ